jgi:hypothetical protein
MSNLRINVILDILIQYKKREIAVGSIVIIQAE